MNRHATGVIVDGGICDIEDSIKIGVPTYYRCIVPNAGKPHEQGGVVDISVVC